LLLNEPPSHEREPVLCASLAR